MTDQELIKALRMCNTANCGECLKTHTVCWRKKWMSDAAARLEALLAENERLKAQVPKWVSAEERMPEKDGRYLCVRRIGESGMCYVTIMNGDECGFSMGHIYSDDVTHWQPLPKPLSTEGVGK